MPVNSARLLNKVLMLGYWLLVIGYWLLVIGYWFSDFHIF